MIETTFLNQFVQEQGVITLFLISGYQMKGIISNFDEKTIVLVDYISGVRKLIYKHAISTIEF